MHIEQRKRIWQDARTSRMQQHFFLPDVPPSVRLTYEPLSYNNALKLVDIFENDDNPFIDERFKSIPDVEDYAACMLEYSRHSNQRAAFDWFLKWTETGEYIGVLHLHDLSSQVFGSANKKATIGYGIKESYRGQGLAHEAVAHFSDFLFKNSTREKLLVYTAKTNIGSIRLMESLNWQRVDDKYVYSEEYAYFELLK